LTLLSLIDRYAMSNSKGEGARACARKRARPSQ